ncbi:hypothetical protein GOA81_18025 [Sinorhizobium meliloti]|nr:hypothetical protein [Sinorhizobium meliloti]MDW9798891.1 hypothetical protein [Sinorhizobium meliloti]
MHQKIGFTDNVANKPFHVVSDAQVSLSLGQFINIPGARTGWLKVLQIGTEFRDDVILTTVVVGPPNAQNLSAVEQDIAASTDPFWPQ